MTEERITERTDIDGNVTERIKQGTGSATELIDRLKAEGAFAKVDFNAVLEPAEFVGRSAEQVAELIAAEIEPIRKTYSDRLGQKVELHV